MDPPASDTGMGRARSDNSYLLSLQLYDDEFWGGEFLEQYYIQNHNQTRGGIHHLPHHLIPDERWWYELTRKVRTKILREAHRLDRLADPFPSIQQLVNNNMVKHAYSFGKYVPNSLPVPNPSHHATILTYSALIIAFAKVGSYNIPNSDTSVVRLTLKVMTACFRAKIEPYLYDTRGPSSTAMTSANRAIRYLQRIYSARLADEKKAAQQAARIREEAKLAQKRRLRELQLAEEQRLQTQQLAEERQLRERQHAEDQRIAKRRARETNNQLWRRRTAEITIFRWLRRISFRRIIARRTTHRIAQRTNLHIRCLGASFYANNLKACRPPPSPPAPSNASIHQSQPTDPKMSTHPFRDRGLPLPPLRRQQHNRRPRRRPPRKYRGEPSPSSPTNPSRGNPSTLPSTATQTLSPAPEKNNAVPPSLHSTTDPFPYDAAVAPSATPTSRYQTFNGVTPMPLCFWAAQTTAAQREFNLSIHPPSRQSIFLPHVAATTIQRWLRRTTQRLLLLTSAASTTIQSWYRGTTSRVLFRRVSATSFLQSWYRGAVSRVLLRRDSAARSLQRWLRRTARRVLFQRCSEALCFQPENTWIRRSELAAKAITAALSVQNDLEETFLDDSTTSFTWLLPLVMRHFPGMTSQYNFVPTASLQARAYSMTSEFLSADCKGWADSGAYDFALISSTARCAESLLATARAIHPSDELDMSENFGMAQMEVDEMKQALNLIGAARHSAARKLQLCYRQTLNNKHAPLDTQSSPTAAAPASPVEHSTSHWMDVMKQCRIDDARRKLAATTDDLDQCRINSESAMIAEGTDPLSLAVARFNARINSAEGTDPLSLAVARFNARINSSLAAFETSSSTNN